MKDVSKVAKRASGPMGKMLTIMGHTNFAAPPEIKRAAYEQLLAAAARGALRADVDALSLERVEEAWARVSAVSMSATVIPSASA